MTDAKPRCKAKMGVSAWFEGTRCNYRAKRDGFCLWHHPTARGPTKRERAEAQQARLDAVLKAARELVDWYVPTCGDGMFSDVDNLRKALDEYDRGEK